MTVLIRPPATVNLSIARSIAKIAFATIASGFWRSRRRVVDSHLRRALQMGLLNDLEAGPLTQKLAVAIKIAVSLTINSASHGYCGGQRV